MAATLKVVDEHFGTSARVRRSGVGLRLASERVSAREIIRSRVMAEIVELQQQAYSHTERLGSTRSYIVAVEQGSSEAALNSISSTLRRNAEALDIEAEVDRAIAAFARRRFIMLLDDRQIDDLDEAVGLRPESEVVFVHLMPLKGG